MFINKWLVIDSVKETKEKEELAGLCLYLAADHIKVRDIYFFLQEQPVGKPFTLLLSGDDFKTEPDDSYIEKMTGLFFQPNYYSVNYRPLVFLVNRTQTCTDFLDRLTQKCRAQGLREILIIEAGLPDYLNDSSARFAYQVDNSEINYSLIIKNWLNTYLDNKNPSEIHLLVSSQKENVHEILNKIIEKEHALKNTEDYKIAFAFYQKQQLIDECKHQLFLKTISAKDTQVYLSIQKEERANGLKWYYYEYEILPTWYKQIGHIIKVIMGKRSFKSLFNDNVKKYKD